MAAAAPVCRSLGKNRMLGREGAGENEAEAKLQIKGSDKAVMNQRIAQDND